MLPVCLPDVPRSKALTATSPGLLPHDSTLLVGDGVAGGVTGALPDAGGVALGVELAVCVVLGVAVCERLTPSVWVADADCVRGTADVGRGDTLIDGREYAHVSV